MLGEDEATTLMEHLPPDGWRSVATKTDLEHEIEKVELRLTAAIDRSAREQTRTIIFANVANAVAIGSLVLAAAKL